MRRLILVPALLLVTASCESNPPTDPSLEPAFAKPVSPPAGYVFLGGAFVTPDSGAANTNIASNPSVLSFSTYRPGNQGTIFQTFIEINMDDTKAFLFDAAGDSINCVYEQKGTPDPTKQHNMRQLLKAALDQPADLKRHFVGKVHLANLGVPSDSNWMQAAWPYAQDGSELWLRVGILDTPIPPGTIAPVCNATGNPDEWICEGGAVRLWHRAGPQVSNGAIACHTAPGDAWTVRIRRG